MSNDAHTRRDTLVAALAAASAAGVLGASDASAQAPERAPAAGAELDAHRRDFAFLVGRWNVRHHRLKGRLVGSTEWEDFNGVSTLWLTLDGLGTIDDNVLEIPSGTYRAVGVRAFDPVTRQWAIWWLDGRSPTNIDAPVRGGFANGVGVFEADDSLNGRPIRVRFRWSEITAHSARWEQAFSPDGGASWEVNWVMHFTRAT